MLLIDSYEKLFSNIDYIFYSFLPTVTYFLSVGFYNIFHIDYNKKPSENDIRSSNKYMISISFSNIFLSFPLFNLFSTLEGLTLFNLCLGIFIIDSCQYLCHYIYHYNNYTFSKFHIEHHRPNLIHPSTSFTNNDIAALEDGILILFFIIYFQISYLEYILISCLSIIATVADHTNTGKTKFHYIHHHVNKNYNLQQPFFTFWDHIFGTYHKKTSYKIPFIP